MPDNINMTIHEKKARHALRNIDKARAFEFGDLVQRAYKPDPPKKIIQELRDWLDQYPEIWCIVFDITHVLEKNMIEHLIPQEPARLALEQNLEQIRRDLGYEEATLMEMMLIDNIVLSWLRCQWAELRLVLCMGQDGASTSMAAFWDKRASAAQRRYLRACETLMKIRRLAQGNPALQVNIAAHHGQQVNVAGDMVKK